MSTPNPDAERIEFLHELVGDYCESTGEPQDAPYFHEMIDGKDDKKNEMWGCFIEYANEVMDGYCACGAEDVRFNGVCKDCM